MITEKVRNTFLLTGKIKQHLIGLDYENTRAQFDNKDAAEDYSQFLLDLDMGRGQIYGPFVHQSFNGGEYWWEVAH